MCPKAFERIWKEIIRIDQQAWIDFPQAKKLIGRVKSENIASQKAFIDAGYQEDYHIYELLKESKGEQK